MPPPPWGPGSGATSPSSSRGSRSPGCAMASWCWKAQLWLGVFLGRGLEGADFFGVSWFFSGEETWLVASGEIFSWLMEGGFGLCHGAKSVFWMVILLGGDFFVFWHVQETWRQVGY